MGPPPDDGQPWWQFFQVPDRLIGQVIDLRLTVDGWDYRAGAGTKQKPAGADLSTVHRHCLRANEPGFALDHFDPF